MKALYKYTPYLDIETRDREFFPPLKTVNDKRLYLAARNNDDIKVFHLHASKLRTAFPNRVRHQGISNAQEKIILHESAVSEQPVAAAKKNCYSEWIDAFRARVPNPLRMECNR